VPTTPIDQQLYERWIEWVFSHPAGEPGFEWDRDNDSGGISAGTAVVYMTWLFKAPTKHLESYSDTQISGGLTFLIGEYFFDGLSSLVNPGVPLVQRQRCAHSIFNLFQECFAARCSPSLCHLAESGEKPLNGVCYMWWDFLHHSDAHWEWCHQRELLPYPACTEVYDDLLSVMSKILTLPNDACRESALHGLGHWKERCPTQVDAIVDYFLNSTSDLRPELRTYALKARAGRVL